MELMSREFCYVMVIQQQTHSCRGNSGRNSYYSYFSSQLPPEQNTRELTDRERDAVRMSTLELVLEQAVETGNEEIVENVM